jgi:hypothetical protein
LSLFLPFFASFFLLVHTTLASPTNEPLPQSYSYVSNTDENDDNCDYDDNNNNNNDGSSGGDNK